ncbi:hypothetical protein [Lautropia mirabilis]|uniref:hypothetical protein n=1 Tax=Lautropia mirabilis TaxID=47671 RepID=UPI00288ABE04|nr:hypothetical protein [Lautropia mirabilis]
MSDYLAHLARNLPDLAERGAYGTLLVLVMAAGFVLAWLIQASRRQRVVRQLIETHIQEERAEQEETRLLAEDLAQEQASRLAQQARSIAHLKARLATHIARERGEAVTPGTRPPAAPHAASAPGTRPAEGTTGVRFPATLILEQAETWTASQTRTQTQSRTQTRTGTPARPQTLTRQTTLVATQPDPAPETRPMSSPAPTTRPVRLQHTRTGNVITTAELARRAAARASAIHAAAAERARTAPQPAPAQTPHAATPQTQPAHVPTDAPRPSGSTCVDMATQAALVASRASRLHNAARVSQAGYTLYDATRAAQNEMSLAIAGFELEALKKRLAHELRINREKARLMRQYEQDAEHWHQAHQRAHERCVSLASTIRALETILKQTRHSWAASESELARLREQLRQQQAINLMNVRPPDGPAVPRTPGTGSGNDHPPLSMLLRDRLNQAARSLGRHSGVMGGAGPQ